MTSFVLAILLVTSATGASVRIASDGAIVGVPVAVDVTWDIDAVGETPIAPASGCELGAFVVFSASVDVDASVVHMLLLPTRPGELEIPRFLLSVEGGAPGSSIDVPATPITVLSAFAPGETPALVDDLELETFATPGPSPWWLAFLLPVIAWWVARSRRAPEPTPHRPVTVVAPVDPAARALERLLALRERAGAASTPPEPEREDVASAADVVRVYIDARVGGGQLTRTHDELEPVIASVAGTSALSGLLGDAELAKFASRAPTHGRYLDDLDRAIAWLRAGSTS